MNEEKAKALEIIRQDDNHHIELLIIHTAGAITKRADGKPISYDIGWAINHLKAFQDEARIELGSDITQRPQ